MRKIVFSLPEFVILLLSGAWFLENFNRTINYIALGVVLLMIFQLIFNNRYIGFVVSVILALFSLYMVLAVISEFNEFPTANSEALQLLTIGLLLCLLSFCGSVGMFLKYYFKKESLYKPSF